MSRIFYILSAAALLCSLSRAQAQSSGAPEWIWSAQAAKPNEVAFFRTTFQVGQVPAKAVLRVSCDNGAAVVINGQNAGRNRDWQEPLVARVEKFLKPGENWIAVRAGNDEGNIAGLVLEILNGDAKDQRLVTTNGSWKYTARDLAWNKDGANLANWGPAVSLGAYGRQPYGRILDEATGVGATATDTLRVAPGFKVELLYSVPKAEQGSWVSLTYDHKNRLIACDQDGSLYRITVVGQPEPKVEELKTKAGHAHGLLYANNSLYVVVNGPGSGLYRLRDTNGDDQFDEEVLLRSIDGGGEHGPHGVVLGPDKKTLYICGGNHTKIPNPEKSIVPRHWAEDHLIPRMWDANGHAVGILAPGGWIARTDLDGKVWELFSGGYRNQYDVAFTAEGDLFTYDSDMEWDIGTPWYRPTRFCHVVPGSDFGWRSGSTNPPSYYIDSLPPLVNIGPGSPTGVLAGTGAKFPAKYQRAIYGLDWTYGTLYAIHLTPDGATYAGEKEVFIAGRPLPLTDAVILPADGAMYFTIGGRKTQAGLYRVTYVGKEGTAPAGPQPLTSEMVTRRELEALYGAPADPKVVEKAWPYLGHRDRWIRFAARNVIELQPVASWQDRALDEHATVESQLTALLAVIRSGDKSLQPRILQSLKHLNGVSMREAEVLDMLRVYSLCFSRMGKPTDPAVMEDVRSRLEPMFPAPSNNLNKEICELLVFLDSKQVVSKTLALMATAKDDDHLDAPGADLLKLNDNYAKAVREMQETRPNRQQIAYAYRLREAIEGWSPELRKQYFRWFNTARKWRGGNSFGKFLTNIRDLAMEKVPADQRAELQNISGELLHTAQKLPTAKGPGAVYTLDGTLKLAEGKLKSGRNFDNGKTMFQAGLCSTCHRFAGEFGGVGPDLTGVGNRYTLKDLLENIIDPSKVISDQYESTLVEKNDGASVVGRLVSAEGGKLKIVENPLDPEKVTEIPAADVKSKTRFPLSAMPPALLNSMNESEVLDLLAYLMSGGNPQDPAFAK